MKNLPIVLLLAAGFGTRLKELTKDRPKPLIDIGEHRLIDFALTHIKRAKLRDLVINLHYKGDMIKEYLGAGSSYGLNIEYSEEDPILDTGGAIKRVMQMHPGRDVLVYNCDALFGEQLRLASFIEDFYASKNIARMLLTEKREGFGAIGTRVVENAQMALISIPGCELKGRGEIEQEWTFTGIHIFSHKIQVFMEEMGEVFGSIRTLYPSILRAGAPIGASQYKGYWQDTGTLERLELVKKDYEQGLFDSIFG